MKISPEYEGAILTTTYVAGTDTSTTGNMISDTATGSATLQNYYQWTRTQSTMHFYTVAVKVELPEDFSDWTTSPDAAVVDYVTQENTTTNNLLDVYVYRDDSTASPVVFSTNNKSATAATWTTINFTKSQLDDGVGVDWDTAGQEVVFYFRMGSQSNKYVRIGDITLSYLSKF